MPWEVWDPGLDLGGGGCQHQLGVDRHRHLVRAGIHRDPSQQENLEKEGAEVLEVGRDGFCMRPCLQHGREVAETEAKRRQARFASRDWAQSGIEDSRRPHSDGGPGSSS
jgi:hypothetical protein